MQITQPIQNTQKQNIEPNYYKKGNGIARASLACSCCSLFIIQTLILSILGIVFGGIGLSKAETQGEKGFAIAGLTIGIITLILGFIVLASI